MPNPKRRHSVTRKNKRRTHDSLAKISLTKCSNCGAKILLHNLCPDCGYYKGKQVVNKKVKDKKTKKA